MNFMEAIEAMKEGKQVRLIHHRAVLPWVYKEGTFQIVDDKNIFPGKFELTHFEGDWEIYEEPKKTLWDKRTPEYNISGNHIPQEDVFCVSNVKQAFKEINSELKAIYKMGEEITPDTIERVIQKHAGKEILRK